MITVDDLKTLGFREYKVNKDLDYVYGAKSSDFYFKPTDCLGYSLGIDLVNRSCFHFECAVPSRHPYPSQAHVHVHLAFPESLDDVRSIFYALTGTRLQAAQDQQNKPS